MIEKERDTPMNCLTTDRLLLRPLVMADAEAVFAYAVSPNVGPNAGWKPHESLAETREVMRAIFVGKEDVWGVITAADRQLIGTVGLIDDPRRSFAGAKMLGYAIGEAYWGQGYATEAAKEVVRYAFLQKRLPILSAYCYPYNLSSRHVLEKCGFTNEGRLRYCEQLYDGRIVDNLCFSCLRSDYNPASP